MTELQEIILRDEEFLPALIADINTAQSTIDFETYIFDQGIAGERLTTAFCAAAERGVKIRILVDGVGTRDWGSGMTIQMEKLGIITKIFHPIPWYLSQWTRSNCSVTEMVFRINTRNHRKLCIIDAKIVYAGSANITDHLLPDNGAPNVWRDTTVKLTDASITTLQYAFEKSWGSIPLKKRFSAIFSNLTPDPIFRMNHSWQLRLANNRMLYGKLKNCSQRIWIESPYFIPNGRLLKLLLRARARGVEVKIIIPQNSDVLISSLATKTFFNILLKSGAFIYEFVPRVLHSKIIIIDDWHSVGSSNMNNRSRQLDLELDVNIQTISAKQTLEKHFYEDVNQSNLITPDDVSRQSIFSYTIGRLLLYLRYWM